MRKRLIRLGREAAVDGARAVRPRRRDRRQDRRDPYQRHVELRARRHRRPARPDLQDPLRPLPVEIPGQVHQQFPGPGHAIPVLPGRRLVRAARPAGHRPARRRHQRLQGSSRPAEGTDRLGPEPPGRAGQIRAGGRAVYASTPLLDPKLQTLTIEPVAPLGDGLSTVNLSLTDDGGARLLDRVTVQINPGEKVAVVGTAASGAEALAEAFSRLIWPGSGRITAGSSDLLDVPRNRSPDGASPMLRQDPICSRASLRDNLLYGLKHAR